MVPNSEDPLQVRPLNDIRHAFSIEMKSRTHVSNLVLSDKTQNLVVFEGDLGTMESLSFVDEYILEFIGSYGTLRLNLSKHMLQDSLNKKNENVFDGINEHAHGGGKADE